MKRLALILTLIALIVAGCGAAAQPARESAPGAPAQPPMAEEAFDKATGGADGVATETVLQERKVIYNADLTLIVADTEATAGRIDQMAGELDGYVANLNAYRGEGDILYYNITLRIPAQQFDAARAALRDMAVRVDNESIHTDDVTDQYFDIEARLRTLRATETELLALLQETRERGGEVEDIMSIYRELTEIQSEIESLQGQLNRLDKLIALSTITINLRPDELAQPITSQWRPLETLRDSFRTLINVLRGLVDLLIGFVVVVLPTLVVLAIPVLLILFALRWIIRRLRGRGERQSGDQA